MVKVLLIESSVKIQAQLSGALKKIRFDVETSNWASEAMTRLDEFHFDLVLIRDNLEDMSGCAFLTELRKKPEHAHFPIVIIYGKMDSKTRMDAWRAGADDVIGMPFVLPEVLMQIHVRLQKTHLHRNLVIPPALKRVSMKSAGPDAHVETLPLHGTVESRPLPVCLSSLFFSRSTGTLRFIEGKHIRSFYLENGYIRGTTSSHKDECLQRLMLKWFDFPGETRRQFKLIPETASDTEVTGSVASFCGLQESAIDAIKVRHMHYVVQGAVRMQKGEFDWAPNEKAHEISLVSFRGLHPVNLLLTVIRDTTPPPNYGHLILNKEFRLAPSPDEGLLRETYRLTEPETCVVALTASGISIGNWMKQSKVILPYADAFIYITLVFRIFAAVERTELRPDEIAAVILPPPFSVEESESIVDLTETVDAVIPEQETGKQGETAAEPSAGQVADEVTDVDLRPVTKRAQTAESMPTKIADKKPAASATEEHGKPQNLLDQEIHEINKQQTTPHRKYQKLWSEMAEPGTRQKAPAEPIKALDLYQLSESHLSKGHIWETHPALVIILALKLKKTGIMMFQDAASETRLYWQNGRLLYAKSNKLSLRIDQVLFDLGIINENQKQDASNLWENSGGMRSGTGLFKHNIVNIMELTEAVKEQIRLIIQDVCNMPAGDYQFLAGALPPEEYIAFDISTERVFMQGIRFLEDFGNLGKIVPNLNVSFTLSTGGILRAQDMRLEGVDISILNRFRKDTSVKAAFAGTDLGLQAFKNSIAGLYLLDLLETTGIQP